MKTYKLFRIRNGKLYPLYVEASREMIVGEWLNAGVGALIDETHVKASGCGGKLALRPGFHSTLIPFTDWIGKKMPDGTLAQRKDTVWCECEVEGKQHHCNGSRNCWMDGTTSERTRNRKSRGSSRTRSRSIGCYRKRKLNRFAGETVILHSEWRMRHET